MKAIGLLGLAGLVASGSCKEHEENAIRPDAARAMESAASNEERERMLSDDLVRAHKEVWANRAALARAMTPVERAFASEDVRQADEKATALEKRLAKVR